MSENRSRNRKSRAVWLIALGALGGILLAPGSGRETRQTISDELDKGGRYLVALGHDTSVEAGRIAESGKRIARRVTHM
jgi:gas vesicle protein